MKTTIEINGYEIVIEESEGLLTVSALKDGETVEEFELESADEDSEESFDREEEDDFDEAEDDIDDVEDDLDDVEDDLEDVEDDLDTEESGLEDGKLESFNSFIRKRK